MDKAEAVTVLKEFLEDCDEWKTDKTRSPLRTAFEMAYQALCSSGNKYVLTVTYNFDRDSIVREYDTYEEAVKGLETELQSEVKTIREEAGYIPSVLKWREDAVMLVYAEGYKTGETDRNYALEDCVYYRIFKFTM